MVAVSELIGDSDFTVSKLDGMLPAETSGEVAARTPADNQTVRCSSSARTRRSN
jgi:hypothetical protein